MIPRYSRPDMVAIWSPETKFRIWFEIEAHACDAMADLGVIPRANANAVWKAKDVDFDVARIDEIEAVTKHDVIAFLTHLAEIVGSEEARFVHQGMTSSDVLDTTFNVQLTRAADILIADLEALLAALKRRALEHKDTVRIGRSHGIHAEPTTMGLTFARFYAEMDRNLSRMRDARAEIATGAISGAVGTFANIDPAVEDHVCSQMGLVPEPISTQVIPRDRHAAFFATLGVIASSVENIATEIRHMQRTEVLEAEEFFSAGQKGSSAMPHKRNPVLTENLTGLARLVRMAVVPAMENVTLWHERDISHSSKYWAGRHGHAGLRTGASDRGDRQAGDLSRQHAGQYEQVPRPGDVTAGPAGPDPGRGQPRGRLQAGATQRHEGLGRRQGFQNRTAGRHRGLRGTQRRRDRREIRPGLSHQTR